MGMESLIFGGLSAAGGFMQFGAARKQAKMNGLMAIMELQGKYEQVAIQNEQLLQEVDNVRIQAEGATVERLEQLDKVRTNNALFLSTSGLSHNAAEATAAKESARKAGNDVGMIRFNAAATRRNISQQIHVNRESLRYGGMRAATEIGNGWRQAQGIGMQALINTASSLFKYAPPGSFGMRT